MQYKDGRLAGSAGCNRYFAGAKEGDMPGDLVIASVGSTRKMCAPEEMAIETRYLKKLKNVNKFGFLYGQLMLHYNDNGMSKVMLFDKLRP